MVYATGTFESVTPDSRVKDGITAICWCGMSSANGFSGCECILSWKYSVTALVGGSHDVFNEMGYGRDEGEDH